MATPYVCSMMRDAATPRAEAPDLGGSWVVVIGAPRRRAFATPGPHRVKADALQQGLSHRLQLGFRRRLASGLAVAANVVFGAQAFCGPNVHVFMP